MPTLLLRLAGPLQSWGVSSFFDTRDTGREPSKSGIIGMIAAAQGRPREQSVEDLASLRFGVRSDQPGDVMRDFQTAHTNGKDAFVTNRYYLEDACFLVGLEGDRQILEKIAEDLRHPYYPIYMGRRSCPPTGRLVVGIDDRDLHESLASTEWQTSAWVRRSMPPKVCLEISEDNDDGTEEINDFPVSFDQRRRRHSKRGVTRRLDGMTVDNPDARNTSSFNPMFEIARRDRDVSFGS